MRSTTEVPPADPVGAQAPNTPTATTTPALQETLAQFMSMYATLAQVGLLPLIAATSQAERGTKTPTARTPEQQVHVDQVLDIILVPLAVPV